MSVYVSVQSRKKVSEIENVNKGSCMVYFKCDKNTIRVMLLPLQCWERQSWLKSSILHPNTLSSFIMFIDPDAQSDHCLQDETRIRILKPILHGGSKRPPPLTDYCTLILGGCPKWTDFSWLCSFQY